MTKVESSGSDNSTNRSQSRKERQRRGQKKDKSKAPTKIVVRHLPPSMTEEEFLKQIEMPEHDFFYFATADWSLGNCATCRAYITLKSYDDVFLFRDRFDGYVFVDSKGAEYPAIVEFSPFQGLLKNRSRRNDNKANTIELEPHYQQFLAKLEEERVAAAKGSEVKLEFSLDRKKEEITSTPLLQYLAHKKEKRREEAKKRTEEKRRQRDEEKERRREKQQQVTKIMTSDRGGNAGGGGASKHADGGVSDSRNKSSNEAGGERKNSRAKRKAEREQRRKEQREKAKAEEHAKPTDKGESKTNDSMPSEEKATKKYSEKRERDRERNRNRKERDAKDREIKDREAKDREVKEKQAKQEFNKIQTESNANGASSTSAAKEDSTAKPKSKDEQISETVRNFIRSVANVKEFIPKHKQQQLAEETNTGKQPENDSTIKEEKVESVKVEETAAVLPKSETSKPESSKTGLSERQREQQQKREERRIRNKDRPSIAIYTPKPRQRLSEESDAAPSGGKDARCSPTSDCDNSKRDDAKVVKKKVSRYSERRSERRNSLAGKKSKSNDIEDTGNSVDNKEAESSNTPTTVANQSSQEAEQLKAASD